MIEVKLRAYTKVVDDSDREVEMGPLALATHAAGKCYQAESPKLGRIMDVESSLFKTSHHTTIEHSSFTFDIEGIAVSDITFGAHLASVFYNSDQRSGRFCAKMFENPDFGAIKDYIIGYWPEVEGTPVMTDVMDHIKQGVGIYQAHLPLAARITGNLLKQERPNWKIDANAAIKIAQEQMRMFISTIFPTGFDFTVDLVALASLYKAAWSPGMIDLTDKMVKLVLAKYPEIAYMFSRRGKPWVPYMTDLTADLRFKPDYELMRLDVDLDPVIPEPEDMHPVDLLPFLPEFMDNNVGSIKSWIQISLACMGQDQRHRTINRGAPRLTGDFYLPPVPAKLDMNDVALEHMAKWLQLAERCPSTLAVAIAPYGAMVNYTKRGSWNAIFHEQEKRLCWCAQEEIYHVSREQRLAVQERLKQLGESISLLQVMEPYCARTGKCAEGARYCGRDISLRESGDYFPERKV